MKLNAKLFFLIGSFLLGLNAQANDRMDADYGCQVISEGIEMVPGVGLLTVKNEELKASKDGTYRVFSKKYKGATLRLMIANEYMSVQIQGHKSILPAKQMLPTLTASTLTGRDVNVSGRIQGTLWIAQCTQDKK